MSRCFVVVALLALPRPDPALSQDLPVIPAGTLIRIAAPSEGLNSQRATFVSWQAQSLAAVFSPEGDTMEVSLGSVTRLESFVGRSAGRGAVNGALIGGAALGVVGLLVGRAKVADCSGSFCSIGALNYLVGGFAAGAAVGAPIGSLRPPERWENHRLSPEAGFPEQRLSPNRGFILLVPVAALLVAALTI